MFTGVRKYLFVVLCCFGVYACFLTVAVRTSQHPVAVAPVVVMRSERPTKENTVFVLHVSDHQRWEAVYDTWLREVPNVFVFSSRLPCQVLYSKCLRLEKGLKDPDKTARALAEASKRWPFAQYFFKCDDDTMVYPDNLFRAAGALYTNETFWGGFVMKDGILFTSGGAGYLLSRNLVEMYLDSRAARPGEGHPDYEDVDLARRLKGITPVHIPGTHPHLPERMLSWRLKPSYDHVQGAEPRETITTPPVSWHYVTPERMRALYGKKVPFKKILHQCWVGPQAKRPKGHMDRCKQMYEKAGWEYMLWTEREVAQLGTKKHGDRGLVYQPLFDRLVSGKGELSFPYAAACDLVRLDVVYRYGGMFVDADSECLRPVDDIVDNLEEQCFAGYEADHVHHGGHKLIANGLFGCKPNAWAMYSILSEVKWYLYVGGPAWLTTGPVPFTHTIMKHKLSFRILEPHWFFPLHHGQVARIGRMPRARRIAELKKAIEKAKERKSYFFQFWGSTTQMYEDLAKEFLKQ